MFVTLFLEPDADDLLADEEKRRSRRARRNRPGMVTRVAASDRGRGTRRYGRAVQV
jgi:hypothetical protein